MRLLIFGANGQVGRELVNRCEDRKIDAVHVGRAQCDIRNVADVEAALLAAGPTVVVNAAAYTAVDRAESEPEIAFSTNRNGSLNLARMCEAHAVPLVHLSTDYVFDGTKSEPYVEDDPACPINVYGASKHAGEDAIRSAVERHIIIRTAWVYGCHGKNFLKTMLDLAKTRSEWSVVCDQWGNPTSTVDLADALIAAACAANGKHASWGTYHFAGAGDATWFDFASEVIAAQRRFTGLAPTIRPVATEEYPTAARRPGNSRLQSSLFEATFGVRAAKWPSRVQDTVGTLLQSSNGEP